MTPALPVLSDSEAILIDCQKDSQDGLSPSLMVPLPPGRDGQLTLLLKRRRGNLN